MTTTVNLRVDAEREARRLAVARTFDRTPHARAKNTDHGDGPLIGRARGARRRTALAGHTVFIWQVACEDAAGRRSPEAIVAILALVRFADGRDDGMSHLRNVINAIDANPPGGIQRVLSATQREMAEIVHAHSVARLDRERAIAADIAHAPHSAAYQAGLFDRRNERDHERSHIDRQHAEAMACDRVAAASAAATFTPRRPTLLLVLTAAS